MTAGTPEERRPWWDRGPVLADHKRHKKKLVPPMMSVVPHTAISTLDQIFPELFWMCLVFENVGPHAATRAIIPTVKNLYELDGDRYWYRTSVILRHFSDAEEKLLAAGKSEGLAICGNALRMIARVYHHGCDDLKDSEIDVVRAKSKIVSCIHHYWDKSEPPYCSALATCMVALAVSGRMAFPPDMLTNVNSILAEPGSDVAEATSSGLRAASNAIFPREEDHDSRLWAEVFWNQNYHLDVCRFRGD